MIIKRVQIAEINRARYNPRVKLKPGDPAFEKLKRSVETYGVVAALVVNKQTGNLVAGHQRLSVIEHLGYDEADVVEVDLSIEDEKALNIALNNIQGEWDPQKLGDVLEELLNIPDFDTTITGFDLPDIHAIVAESSLIENNDKEESESDLSVNKEEPAVTQPGEIITLGRHQLLCGDSHDPESLQRLMGDEKADLLFTDPPFNVDYYGGNRPMPEKARPKRSRQWDRIYHDNMAQDEYTAWFKQILENTNQVLSPGSAFYVWNGHRQFGPMHQMVNEMDWCASCVITWAKESFAIGYGDYNQQTEFCLYGWKPTDEKGGHHWFGPTNESTLWKVKRDPTQSYLHPTQKPVVLAERAIRNSTRAGQIVLDTFLGSGSTLIAAERTGRTCVGVEIDAHYCDCVVRRYLSFVNDTDKNHELRDRYGQNVFDGVAVVEEA